MYPVVIIKTFYFFLTEKFEWTSGGGSTRTRQAPRGERFAGR